MSEPAVDSFAQGLRAALRGIFTALGTRATRRVYAGLVAAQLLVSVAVLAGLLALTFALTAPTEAASALTQAGWIALRIVGVIASLILAPVLSILMVNLALPLVADHLFLESLRSIDARRAAELEALPGLPVHRQVVLAARRLVVIVSALAGCLLLAFIPVVGPLLAPVVEIYVAARLLAAEFLDPYLGRLGLEHAAQRAFRRKHRAATLGFSLPFVPLVAIPLLGPLLVGLAVAATARLVIDVLEKPGDSAATAGRSPGP